MQSPEHYIDEDQWPHLLAAPEAAFMSRRAATVSDRLNSLVVDRGIAMDSQSDPHLLVRDGQVIDRIVAAGWLGLAEGYMAGEWSAEPLPEVLRALLSQPFEGRLGQLLGRRKPSRQARFGGPHSGEFPEALIELYAGATRATGSALFSSASRTTTSHPVEVPGKGNNDDAMLIDQTWFGTPTVVERADLDDAQHRRIAAMLNLAAVRAGDRVLELPSSGGQLAIQAAQRGAHVDVLTSDEDHAEAVRARVRAVGLSGAVHVEVIGGPIPSPRQWSGRYDAIFSVERMETLGLGGMQHFLRAVDRMLAADGVAVIQSLVATPEMRAEASEALDVMRAYVWPALDYPSVEAVRAAVVKYTGLTVQAEAHLGEHLRATIPLWRANFLAQDRQAAAAGFDKVFRRLWDYQLALHEALVAEKDIDCVQFVLRPRR